MAKNPLEYYLMQAIGETPSSPLPNRPLEYYMERISGETGGGGVAGKVDKQQDPADAGKALIIGETGELEPGVSGRVDTVEGLESDDNKNVRLTYTYSTEAEYEADKDNVPDGARVIKLYEYPDNLAGFMVVPDYNNYTSIPALSALNTEYVVQQTGYIQGWARVTSGAVNELVTIVAGSMSSSNKRTIISSNPSSAAGARIEVTAWFPVKKGDIVYFGYSGSGTLVTCAGQFVNPRLVAKELPVVVERNGSYSTDEIKTADTWIDGRPIYKRTFGVQVTSTAAGEIIRTTLPNSRIVDMNWDIPVKVEGTWQVGTNTVPPYNSYWNFAVNSGDGAIQSWWSYQTIDGYVCLSVHTKTSSIRTNYPVYVTFYYVKTTD
jgi:hypothetical protein